MVNNPIVIVDDDQDDIDIVSTVIREIGVLNELVALNSGKELIDYLRTTDKSPFLIVCDINLPRENGFDIRARIEEDKELHYKSVPFLFWSTAASETQIRRAYDMHSQGFFSKPSSKGELRRHLQVIVDYWSLSMHPKQL